MKRFLFLFLLLLSLASCEKNYVSQIPYAPVNFAIDLRYQDKDLVGILNYKTFTSPRNAGEYVGFSGILIVCGFDNVYYAYDLCCPHEARQDIKIIPNNEGTAKCNKCGTEYEIGYGTGRPAGISEYSLRKFNIRPNGQELYIYY